MITKRIFDTLPSGEAVTAYTLHGKDGTGAEVLDLGGTLRSLWVRDRNGTVRDVCLGYDTAREYLCQGGHMGGTIGRYANRIGGGILAVGENTYRLYCKDGVNHIHGGKAGFDAFLWKGEITGDDRLILRRTSPDGEENYPGAMEVSVTFSFSEQEGLTISYRAVSDRDTVVNLTNHAYWNLNGHDEGDAMGHLLQIHAQAITEGDERSLPTGKLLPVAGTPFDFRRPKKLRQDLEDSHIQMKWGNGYDHNFVLDKEGMGLAATLTGDRSGIVMEVFTDQPGMQLYTANSLGERPGKGGAVYGPRCAVCLETQHFPDSPAHPEFPSVFLPAGAVFESVTVHRFSV